VITVNADVLFAFDKATLTAPALQTIANLARRIPHRPGTTLHLDGYTDSIGTPGLQTRAVTAPAPPPWPPPCSMTLVQGPRRSSPAGTGRAQNRRVTIAFPGT